MKKYRNSLLFEISIQQVKKKYVIGENEKEAMVAGEGNTVLHTRHPHGLLQWTLGWTERLQGILALQPLASHRPSCGSRMATKPDRSSSMTFRDFIDPLSMS